MCSWAGIGAAPGQLLAAEGGRELDQGEGVPGGLRHQPLRHVARQRAPGRLGEQRAEQLRRSAASAPRRGHRRVRTCGLRRRGRRTRRRPGSAPSRRDGDQHCVRGGLGRAMRVVDEAERAARPRRPRSTSTGSRAPPGTAAPLTVVLLAEHGPQRAGLRGREPVEDAEDRTQQPVQRRERQRRLGLHALGAQHPDVAAGVRDEVLEQRGLPCAGLPMQQQSPGVAVAAPSRSAARRARSASRPCSTTGDATPDSSARLLAAARAHSRANTSESPRPGSCGTRSSAGATSGPRAQAQHAPPARLAAPTTGSETVMTTPTPTPTPTGPPIGLRASWAVLALALTAQILVVLDISVVNTALPTIGRVAAPGQQRPAVARHRLPAALRRRAAARRPHRRPAVAPPGVPHRHGHLHRRLPGQRVRRSAAELIAARAAQGLGAALMTPPRCPS